MTSSTTTQASTPQTHFTPATLNQLGLIGSSLLVAISYHNTEIQQRGIKGALSHIKPLKKLISLSETTSLDLDLSCLVFDKSFNLLDCIDYTRLRNDNESIRHTGDALSGARNFEETLINQEEIRLRLDALPDDAHHLAFIISNTQGAPLNLATKGVGILMDNEHHTAHAFELASLPKICKNLLIWHLARQNGDWLVRALVQPLDDVDTSREFSEQTKNFIK